MSLSLSRGSLNQGEANTLLEEGRCDGCPEELFDPSELRVVEIFQGTLVLCPECFFFLITPCKGEC
jgi:predicted  nucleic acid-binding Zn-ribbon protein